MDGVLRTGKKDRKPVSHFLSIFVESKEHGQSIFISSLPFLTSDSTLKICDASRHLNASLQFFKPRPNFPFELNVQANEWYTAAAL